MFPRLVLPVGQFGLDGTVYVSGGQPVSAVPVPAAAWLMVSGLVGLAGVARRRNST